MAVFNHLQADVKALPLADNSADALLCDPPYGLGFMGKAWDRSVPPVETWREVFRVLKPGGYGFVFGGTRTFPFLAINLVEAGFELRDTVLWLYGSGFPKSLNVGKAIDKLARRDYVKAALRLGLEVPDKNIWDWLEDGHTPGDKWWEKFKEHLSAEQWMAVEREVVGQETKARSASGKSALPTVGGATVYETWNLTAPATPEAARWEGYGTALKPAWEPVLLIRKPPEGTNAESCVKWGTGALNIDGGRVGMGESDRKAYIEKRLSFSGMTGKKTRSWKNCSPCQSPESAIENSQNGRWPANLVLSHTPECRLRGVKRVKGAGWRPDQAQPPVGEGWGSIQRGRGEAYADPDGLETVEDWDCLEGGIVKTYGVRNTWASFTPLDDPPDLLAALDRLLTHLGQLEDSLCNRIEGTHTLTGCELGRALGLSTLPSFRACCPTCFRSYDELAQAVLGGGPVSSRQLHGALAAVYQVLRSRLHSPAGPLSYRPSSGDAPDQLRRESYKETSNTSEGCPPREPLGETSCHTRDTAGGESAHTASGSSRHVSKTSALAGSCERSDHTSCTETLVRLFAWLAFEASRDLFATEVYHTELELSSCPVRLLDEQSGELKSGKAAKYPKQSCETSGDWGNIGINGHGRLIGDTGGASRFFKCCLPDSRMFYTAKASSSERGQGCEGLYWRREPLELIDLETWEGLEPKDRAQGCIHPTVKPVDLCRWLATLLLPPERETPRTLLVPFAGSGSEMIGAHLAGWDRIVGVELNSEYVEIQRRRCEWWAEHGAQGVETSAILAEGQTRSTEQAAGQLELEGA